jgi:RIO-like serine/threonine protein kinase
VITIKTGFALVPAKAARAELSATDFRVLLAIGLHADKDGRAYPSMARLGEITGIRRGDIPRSLKRLEECGLLRRQRVPRAKGGWQVNQYELVYEPLGMSAILRTGMYAIPRTPSMYANLRTGVRKTAYRVSARLRH